MTSEEAERNIEKRARKMCEEKDGDEGDDRGEDFLTGGANFVYDRR